MYAIHLPSGARENHGARHPVLHAACGVLPLELHENVRALWWDDFAESSYRCVSNGVENVHCSAFHGAGISACEAPR